MSIVRRNCRWHDVYNILFDGREGHWLMVMEIGQIAH